MRTARQALPSVQGTVDGAKQPNPESKSVRVHYSQKNHNQCLRIHCYATEDPRDSCEVRLPVVTLRVIVPAKWARR